MPLRIDILTLFPEMFPPILGTSIPKRAAEKGLVEYHLTNFRDFATDAHKSVDDKPFGGGPGMVMMAPVGLDAVEHVVKIDARSATRVSRHGCAGCAAVGRSPQDCPVEAGAAEAENERAPAGFVAGAQRRDEDEQ